MYSQVKPNDKFVFDQENNNWQVCTLSVYG